MRTQRQRDAFSRLHPWIRRTLVSHRLDEFETEERASFVTRRALERTNGPTQWDATVAELAQGEPWLLSDRCASTTADYAATLDEIGVELGVSLQRVRQIEARALRVLRADPLVREMWTGEPPRYEPVDTSLIDAALARAFTPCACCGETRDKHERGRCPP